MQSVRPKLGDRVKTSAFLVRKLSWGKDEYMREARLKVWERFELPDDQEGIYVGRRMKSNGTTRHIYEEGTIYNPVAYFEVWLVAYSESRDILVCLPKDVRTPDGRLICQENPERA